VIERQPGWAAQTCSECGSRSRRRKLKDAAATFICLIEISDNIKGQTIWLVKSSSECALNSPWGNLCNGIAAVVSDKEVVLAIKCKARGTSESGGEGCFGTCRCKTENIATSEIGFVEIANSSVTHRNHC
jgi:hypothetical protein